MAAEEVAAEEVAADSRDQIPAPAARSFRSNFGDHALDSGQ